MKMHEQTLKFGDIVVEKKKNFMLLKKQLL